jgi:Ca-activated chloride channel homolog
MQLLERAPETVCADELEALFEEARQRQRRRRARVALAAAGAILVGVGVYAVLATGAHSTRAVESHDAAGRAAGTVRPRVIVFAVDMSGSMAATDIHPTRLQATVTALKAFVARLDPGVEVGLVSFSVDAHVLVPPTTDRARLDGALASLIPSGGTALGDGLRAASVSTIAALTRAGIDRKRDGLVPGAIVLISDGAQNRGELQPAAAAARARRDGLRIFGVALGKPHGSVAFGAGTTINRVPVPPDPKDVRTIASITHGQAFTAESAGSLEAALGRFASELGR